MLLSSGPLRMEPDIGLVWLSAEDDSLEPCGFIGDEDACPPGHERDWESLLDAWNDSRGGGHRREAEWSYYDRLSVARMN